MSATQLLKNRIKTTTNVSGKCDTLNGLATSNLGQKTNQSWQRAPAEHLEKRSLSPNPIGRSPFKNPSRHNQNGSHEQIPTGLRSSPHCRPALFGRMFCVNRVETWFEIAKTQSSMLNCYFTFVTIYPKVSPYETLHRIIFHSFKYIINILIIITRFLTDFEINKFATITRTLMNMARFYFSLRSNAILILITLYIFLTDP